MLNNEQENNNSKVKIREYLEKYPSEVELLAYLMYQEKISEIMKDISKYNQANENFRGWILPDGQMVNYFYDESLFPKIVQDHGQLFRIFLLGLEKYDQKTYSKIQTELKKYSHNNYDANEPYESFAVERLGWLQVGIFGKKYIICRGERFQDKYLKPYIIDKNYHVIYHNKGTLINNLLEPIYPQFKKIFKIGLERLYKPSIKEALDAIKNESKRK